jgi:hypothetical protein
MDGRSTSPWSAARHLALATVVSLAAVMTANAAFAGQCPADKRGVDVTKPNNVAAKEVTDKVLASIDLAKEKVALADHHLRIRQLDIKPGGIYEYASNCAVPILHKAGEVAPETSATAHWWKNTGTETVVLISADLLHDENDHNM